jgi:hypothetical protein
MIFRTNKPPFEIRENHDGEGTAKYQLAILNQKNKPTFNKDKIIEFSKTNR